MSPFLYLYIMKLQEFIDNFNDGEDSQILKWFGSMDTFFELIEKNNKWDLLDENIMEDEYTNYEYLHLYKLSSRVFAAA